MACIVVPDYDINLANVLVTGGDVWANTPLPPIEASGTSGIRAALNGALGLSVLDGWRIEANVESVAGVSICADGDRDPTAYAAMLYDKVEQIVLPIDYADQASWRWMIKQAIGVIGFHYNRQHMMRRYAIEALFALRLRRWCSQLTPTLRSGRRLRCHRSARPESQGLVLCRQGSRRCRTRGRR